MTWTPERHQAAKQRCENATPITWYCEEPGHDSPFTEEYDYALRAKPDPLTTIGSHKIGSLYRPDDADFVSHVRTDLPDALAEIERLQALVDEVEAERDQLAAYVDHLGFWTDYLEQESDS